MPSHFAKDENSNNYKLLSLIAKGSEETRTIYETMLKFWDVDQSEGVGLNRLGKDEGIFRGGWDDAEYRKMIKIQSILNLSDADIESMNLILDAYMGEEFIGFQDGWEIDPASMYLNVTNKATTVPFELITRIKPAGVRVYILLNELNEKIIMYGETYTWQLNNKICGRFKTETVYGTIGKEVFNYPNQSYAFTVNHSICGRFRAGGVKG